MMKIIEPRSGRSRGSRRMVCGVKEVVINGGSSNGGGRSKNVVGEETTKQLFYRTITKILNNYD